MSAGRLAGLARLEGPATMWKIDKYEIRSERVGDQSVVYSAWDPGLGREVTLEGPLPADASDPIYIKNFLEEGRRLGKLHHENVVSLYDVVEPSAADPACYLVFEKVEGTLEDRIASGRTDARLAERVLRDILCGLQALHRAGLIHANVTPDSILIATDGSAKISDLRRARSRGRRPTISLRLEGAYLPPEAWRDDLKFGEWSDLYALGCVVYEVVVGRARFRSMLEGARSGATGGPEVVSASAAWHSDLTLEAPPLREIVPGSSAELSRVVERMMEKRVEHRFPDARAALDALGEGGRREPGSERLTEKSAPSGRGATVVLPAPRPQADTTASAPSPVAVPRRSLWRDAMWLGLAVLIGILVMLVIINLS